jgi:hypothetical protein
MDGLRVPVVQVGWGYLKAILVNGEEPVFGRDEKELVGRLKFRTALAGVHSHLIERALDVLGRK